MTVAKPRDRVVVFRLTEEEHEQLLKACALRSGRSVSEFVRSELLTLLRSCNDSPAVSPEELARRVVDLEVKSAALARRIERLDGTEN